MKEIPYVCLYRDRLSFFRNYSDEEVGRMVRALLLYAYEDVEPEFTGPERFIWPMLQAQVDRDNESYEARCRRGRRSKKKEAAEPE